MTVQVDYLINRSFRIKEPGDKYKISTRHRSHENFVPQFDTVEACLHEYCNGYHIVPGKFERDDTGAIRKKDCWKHQQLFLVEVDKDVQETSLLKVVENNPFVQENAYALTESVRSKYNDPSDGGCNGELRYRIWFVAPQPGNQMDEIDWFLKHLLMEFPTADPAGSIITSGCYGRSGAASLVLGHSISKNVMSTWGNAWYEEKRKRQSRRRKPTNRMRDALYNTVRNFTYGPDGWSRETLPCILSEHHNDGPLGDSANRMYVKRTTTEYFLYCHKCGKHTTYRRY